MARGRGTPSDRLGDGVRGRLGIYSDDVFRVEQTPAGRRITGDQAFLLFACAVGARFDGFELFGRALHNAPPAEHVLPSEAGLVELPHYESLRQPGQMLRAARGTVAAMWRGLSGVEAVWVLGPNPFGLVLVALALLRRKRVALGVRQQTVAYYRSRLPSRRWTPALPAIWAMDRVYRLLARRLPTMVVGAELARGYSGGGACVQPMTVTLVAASDVLGRPPERLWDGEVQLLAVGRIDREKNPLLLVEALARLDIAEPARYRLRVVGRGPLEDAMRQRALDLGVADRIEFCGYVPFGPALLDLYRRSHMLVHVALTEGVPQVLVEALACGTPIVATDVGGVRGALDSGRAGLLVPPSDLDALERAIRQLAGDAELRGRLVERGLELARGLTLEVEAARVAQFLQKAALAASRSAACSRR
jgi:glycosyltransferase involved in cell wall biosynthesis